VGYLVRGVPAAFALDARRIASIAPPPASPAPPGVVAAELGRLALKVAESSGRARDRSFARELLAFAQRQDPGDARVLASLGQALAMAGGSRAAAEAVDRALAEAPDDPWVWLRAGRIALAADRRDEAESRFRRAIELDPRSAVAWLDLGIALHAADRADDALLAFEMSRSLVWSPAVDLELGRLHLAAGRRQEALAALLPLARDPHGGATGDEAAQLLEQAELARADDPSP